MNRLRLQGSEMIIATPYAFAGYHIAEAMGKRRHRFAWLRRALRI